MRFFVIGKEELLIMGEMGQGSNSCEEDKGLIRQELL